MFDKIGNRPITVLTTFPDQDSAQKFAHAIIHSNLAACVNLIKGVESVYKWEGEIHTDSETMLIIKSNHNQFESVKALLLEIHPYDLPECVMLEISDGHQPYLDWLTALGS